MEREQKKNGEHPLTPDSDLLRNVSSELNNALPSMKLGEMTPETIQNQNQSQENGHQSPGISGSKRSASDRAPKTVSEQESKSAVRLAKDVKDLQGLYENVGALVCLRDPLTGLIIVNSAEERATDVINVAKHHPRLLRAIRRMSKGGDYMACIMGHFSMIAAILAVHGKFPLEYAAGYLQRIGLNPADFMPLEAQNGHTADTNIFTGVGN